MKSDLFDYDSEFDSFIYECIHWCWDSTFPTQLKFYIFYFTFWGKSHKLWFSFGFSPRQWIGNNSYFNKKKKRRLSDKRRHCLHDCNLQTVHRKIFLSCLFGFLFVAVSHAMQMKCKNNFQNWFALRDFQSVMMHTRCCVNFQTKGLVCVCRAKPKFVLIFIATLYCCYYHCLRSFVARLLCEKLPFWRHLISLPSSRAHARTRHKSINNTILCVPCNRIAK